MKELGEFFDMGGYAAYVWPSYVLTLVVVVLNVVWARRLLAKSREEARRRLATRASAGAGETT
jgi:heme exporter protein D